MTPKEIFSYGGGIATFVLVSWLLRAWVPIEFALCIGALAMLLVGFPFTRYLSKRQLSFRRWVVFSTCGALAGAAVLFLIRHVR